jgi:hypothetical protein
MPIVIFLIGIATGAASPLSSRMHPWTMFFNGDCASNNPTAATLPAEEDSISLFLSRTGARRCETVF